MMPFAAATRSGVFARAFTLVELFIVVAVLAIAVTLGVPTFSSMIEGTNRTFAENALQESITQARFLATAFERDSAAVFLYEPGGSLRIVPMLKVGEFEEPLGDPFGGASGGGGGGGGFNPGSFNALIDPSAGVREVFAPVAEAAGFVLPRGWMVRGFVPAGRLLPTNPSINPDPEWYDSELYGGNDTTSQAKLEGNWVAPEDGYFNRFSPGGSAPVAGGGLGTPRSSFMIRFEASTGVVRFDTRPAVCVSPRGSDRNAVSVGDRALRIDLAEDLEAWAVQVTQASIGQFTGTGSGNPANAAGRRAELIGVYSNETVLAGPVTRLALFRETDLALAVGATDVNGVSGTLYEPVEKQIDVNAFNAPTDQAEIVLDVNPGVTVGERRFSDGVLSAWSGDLDALRVSINQWMEGDSNERFEPGWSVPQLIGDGDAQDETDEGADQVFVIDAISGDLVVARGGEL